MEESKAIKQKIEYNYDALHRLTRVKFGEEVSIHYAYDPAGNLVAIGKEVGVAPVKAPVKAKASTFKTDIEKAATSVAEKERSVKETTETKAYAGRETWHIYRDGVHYGPYTDADMIGFARQGNLQPEDLVWSEKTGDWVRADSIGTFFA